MPKTYQDLVAEARKQVPEISAEEVQKKAERGEEFILLDVRDPEEFRSGHLPRAQSISRGMLEFRAKEVLASLEKPIVVYCATGQRSLLAGQTLKGLGYWHVHSLAGGIRRWRDLGYPTVRESQLSPQQLERYSRQILLPQVGEKGQQKLLQAKVLAVGAGGLGSPAAIYLAAAGVGKLGIVDSDRVDLSNLQRQILHSTQDIGEPKVESARRTLKQLNPDIQVITYPQRLDPSTVAALIAEYDLILDGADNFPTKYLLNDACYFAAKPLVYGSIFQFEGQASVFHRNHGPCYRCLFPHPPPAGLIPTCNEAGVLGVVPGLIGLIQATEAIKWILGAGTSLLGRLLIYDSLEMSFREVKLPAHPDCPLCGTHPTILSLEEGGHEASPLPTCPPAAPSR